MIRILLPLAIIAAIFFGPMYSFESENPISGQEEKSVVTGAKFIGGAVECVRAQRLPIGEECASDARVNDSTMAGNLISYASSLSLGAAALGVIGLLPLIGRITSIVTVGAGLGALGAIGYFAMEMMNTSAGLGGLEWGAYLAGGLGLLTMISGLSGMRGQ
ncbi:MAG: hypothetical protein AAGA09_06355 [Pseudomonadota bacterium]